MKKYDLIVIGGGQSALALAYFLRRTDWNYTLLDDQERPGGAWLHGWDSLTLFSPAQFSSLPGWFMPESSGKFPSRDETIQYLDAYEKRYDIPVIRSTKVLDVEKTENGFVLYTTKGYYLTDALISATGTWSAPYIPKIKGLDKFQGIQLHSAEYKSPNILKNKKVLIVGGGNSGAQLLSEISTTANTVWSTIDKPAFLPDDVDGRVLFDSATSIYNSLNEFPKMEIPKYNLTDIVMIPSVIDARKRNVLYSKGKILSIGKDEVNWETGEIEKIDAIVWCTGFRPSTEHLKNLKISYEDGLIHTSGTAVYDMPGLWLVGYGNWTGFASATLIGVGRTARETVKEVTSYLSHF